MKALAVALSVALATPCWADDAPTKLCLEPADRIALAQKLTGLEAENAALQSSVRAAPSTALVVVLVVAGVLVGGAAGAAVAVAVKK